MMLSKTSLPLKQKKYRTVLADPPWKSGKGWDVWGNEVESDIIL